MAKKETLENAPEELELNDVKKEDLGKPIEPEPMPKKVEKKRVIIEEKVPPRPTKDDLDKAGAITITQFIRSETLGILKQGFAIYCQEKGVGGRKPRADWMALFEAYKSAPVASKRKRRGN